RMSTNREAGLEETKAQLLGDARLAAAAGEHIGVLEELAPKLGAELAASLLPAPLGAEHASQPTSHAEASTQSARRPMLRTRLFLRG
ncbi:MAG TPA: hypothetical protein PKD61_32660, partial [Polyangiaceae bacterium]|nr:hypothetical protein [Polyangiaceae bacterium]